MSEASSHLGKPLPPPPPQTGVTDEARPAHTAAAHFAEHVRSAKYRRHHTRHD